MLDTCSGAITSIVGVPVPLPWMTARDDLDYVRSTVKKIVHTAKLRDELSFSSFRHGGFTEAGDAEMTDREIMAQGRHKSPKVLSRYVKRTMRQVATGAEKRRAARKKRDFLSE